MSSRSRRAVSKPLPESSGEPTREALLAALAERERELAEAREQQAAVAEVLEVINASPGDLARVFAAIAEKAVRLCEASEGLFWVVDGETARLPDHQGGDWAENLPRSAPVRDLLGREDHRPPFLHIDDLKATKAYQKRAPLIATAVELGGVRTNLTVPMLDGGALVGVFTLARREVRPFTDNQIALVQAFAAQALIAMKNARLFNETNEALERQTATAEILKVIASSPSDAQPVFDAIAESAKRLVGAKAALVFRVIDGMIHLAAHTALPTREEEAALLALYPRPYAESVYARVEKAGEPLVYPDVDSMPPYMRGFMTRFGNASFTAAPMTSLGRGLGVVSVLRSERGSLPAHQVQLLQTFADQAVIAIENARLFNETQEALERQTATAEVLKVISRSAFDLQTVLDMLVRSAAELVDAAHGSIHIREGEVYPYKSGFGFNPGIRSLIRQNPISPGRETLAGRVAMSGRVESIPDVLADAEFSPSLKAAIEVRSILGVPLLCDDRVEGMMILGRTEPGPFTPRQIELVLTFADQAVIAIQNARLFEEVQARTRDLTEALQQQTATADVLKVISRSAFDLQTVLDTLARSAAGLCDAPQAMILLRHGDRLTFKAAFGFSPEALGSQAETPLTATRATVAGRILLFGELQHVPDIREDKEYVRPLQGSQYRAILGVPLIRDHTVVGAITLTRPEAGPFSERQIELVRTFADQAVIAIENARLFDEVQAKTKDLQEALQQQTATANVLKVISRSAFDLQTVLDTLAASAAKLCDADQAGVFQRQGDLYHWVSNYGYSPELAAYAYAHPFAPGLGSTTSRVALEGRTIHNPDVLADPNYLAVEYQRLGRYRTNLGVPLLREGAPIGVFILTRQEVRPFTQRQIELVETFADQAVIAVENARLFDEVQAKTRDLEEALQQQTATADVLKVISRSAFDLDTIFQTLVATAVDLCKASSGTLCVRDGDVFRYQGMAGPDSSPDLQRYLADHPIVEPDGHTVAGRTILSKTVEHVPDIASDPSYAVPLAAHGNPARALLGVPLLGKDRVEGALALTRKEPGEFPARQIEILKTFADQAVIAIENARLFKQVQARTQELAASLDDLRKAQDRLIQSEKLASLGQLTAGIAHEIKNPLNFVNNFSSLSRELVDELAGVIKAAPLEADKREEAEELIDTIGGNLDKVVQHGKRADSIVKNMLLHAREGSGERAPVNVNAMVDEALNLAYHGARAERPGFNVTIMKSLDENAGAAELYPQEMTRVLLNLISNGFYATTKRKQAEANDAYEPTIAATTRDLGHSVEIAIRDNGTGIPDEVKAKMFNPFFTTKPAGEGTGLGLSLSHDIVVKQHGGTLDVSTEPGAFTQFTIVLPRAFVPSPRLRGEG